VKEGSHLGVCVCVSLAVLFFVFALSHRERERERISEIWGKNQYSREHTDPSSSSSLQWSSAHVSIPP
jgi:hypothetical protein